MNDDQAMGLIKEVAEIGTNAIRKEKWLKKNWRFVAICLTVLLSVAMVCGTIWGVTCHLATLDTLKEIVYATEITTETTTVEQDSGDGGDNYYQSGDNNSVGGE